MLLVLRLDLVGSIAAQMRNVRKWTIDVDGLYGNQTASVTRAFQEEKGLGVDGLIGINTWNKAWTAKIT